MNKQKREETANYSPIFKKTLVGHEAGTLILFDALINVDEPFKIEISGAIILSVLLSHRLTNDYLFISYQVAPNQYSKGLKDVYYVAFWFIMFMFLRAVFIKYIYIPLSNYFNIGKSSKRQRVAEQSYIFAYYVIFGTVGMVIYPPPPKKKKHHYLC